jgi:ribosomal protein S18 acetylase RimI-like enzyme
MSPLHGARSSSDSFTRTRDTWLTDVLGVEAWSVDHATHPEGSAVIALTEPFAGPAFLTAKVPAHDTLTVKRLIELGFHLVDTALTLRLDSRRVPESVYQPSPDTPIWSVSDATPEDADSVGLIASEALITSRFHLDPGIASEVASAIKSAWARSLALGHRGIGCRVVQDVNGVQGFLGTVQGKDGQGILIIDLIAVRPESQGRGAGAALVRDFLSRAQGQGALAQVGTQAANTKAVRFYERLGFTLASATYVLHAHVLTEEPS